MSFQHMFAVYPFGIHTQKKEWDPRESYFNLLFYILYKMLLNSGSDGSGLYANVYVNKYIYFDYESD